MDHQSKYKTYNHTTCIRENRKKILVTELSKDSLDATPKGSPIFKIYIEVHTIKCTNLKEKNAWHVDIS